MTLRRRLAVMTAALLLSATDAAFAQQLDLDILTKKPAPAANQPIPASTIKDKPIQVTVSKTLYLPPAMYGQWSVTATLMEANADYSPTVNDIWVLGRKDDQVVISNPVNGASAAISVDKVEGDTAVFHRMLLVGGKRSVTETLTVTIAGDTLQGHNVSRIQIMKDGRVIREYYAIYKIQAERISGARVQFRPEDAAAGPDIEIEDVKKAQ